MDIDRDLNPCNWRPGFSAVAACGCRSEKIPIEHCTHHSCRDLWSWTTYFWIPASRDFTSVWIISPQTYWRCHCRYIIWAYLLRTCRAETYSLVRVTTVHHFLSASRGRQWDRSQFLWPSIVGPETLGCDRLRWLVKVSQSIDPNNTILPLDSATTLINQ